MHERFRPACSNGLAASLLCLVVAAQPAAKSVSPAPGSASLQEEGYLPGPAASRVVTVTTAGRARASVVIQTQAVAVKETGPGRTVRAFGEVYAFSPSFFIVRREEPTLVTFWNLQPDDFHDFMLMDPQYNVLMKLILPPLRKSSWVMTFHREGLFPFYCAAHPPEMSGQILVLPPAGAPSPPGRRRSR